MDTKIYSRALHLAYFYLKFRPRTIREIIKYLEKKSPIFKGEIANAVVLQLVEEKLLDDAVFIHMYVQDRTRFKSRSIFLIKHELAKLGVDKELIEQYFIDHTFDDSTLAIKTLNKKITQFSHLDNLKKYKRSMAYLLRKGFTYHTAKGAYTAVFGAHK